VRRLTRRESAAALKSGHVVAVPTDTVYGVAARLSDARAVARLFTVKSRPRHVALPVLVSSLDQVAALGVAWPDEASRLAEHFWPGALTIVVGADWATASLVGATNSLGLRFPHHDDLVALIAECGPLAVTSANEHGQPPCTSTDDVIAIPWAAPVAGVFDGGACDGAVSSVVELTAHGWRLRRQGAVAAADLEVVLGPESAIRDY
jgi:tRNA threonylcarbamoyl adenosine modification protein (Sua5/YciO/YrdC/YwlC family)